MHCIDLQVNGYMGIDFSSNDLTAEKFRDACNKIIDSGTKYFLPTLITSPIDTYQQNLDIITEVSKDPAIHDAIKGIHLEGPFLSPVKGAAGAHNPHWMQKPDIRLLHQLYDWSDQKIKLITIAAELQGADQFCKEAKKLGIKVSLGHQMAGKKDIQRLTDAGATACTHLGNGMPSHIHRFENPVWICLAHDQLYTMIIGDGHHIPEEFIKVVVKSKGVDRVIVVSDSAPIAGMPPGNYSTLGNKVILQENGYLYNPDTGYMVGSSANLSQCIEYLQTLDFLTIEDIEKMVYYNPFKFLNTDGIS